MYYDFAVAIPSVQGKIIAKKKGSATYILFQYGQKYNPDKKYSIPLRSSIGKAIPDQPGFMYPNEKFWALCSLVFAFLLLQMCWYGVNYLPSSQGASIHMY